MYRIIFSFFLLSVFVQIHGAPQKDDDTALTNTTDQFSSTSSVPPSTTVKPSSNTTCETYNNDCKKCVANSECYYCDSTEVCHHNFGKGIFGGDCDAAHAFYGTCKANVKVLAIIIGVLAGVVILIITCVCCYCCCKKKGMKLSKDDIKWARQREERKQIAAERRQERAERTEEIRKKYGLVKDSNPYQRFDA